MLLKGGKVILNNKQEFFDIKIQKNLVTEIAPNLCDEEIIDCSGLTIMPAFVEMHAHFRDPGFEYKETMETGSFAARKGGYCAVAVMPNTNPVCDNIETLNYVLNKPSSVKILPICALSKSSNSEELTNIVDLKQAGAIAFSDDGKPFKNLDLLEKAMHIAKANDILIISHAEDMKYSPYVNESEYKAVERELVLVEKIGCRYHFAHISTKESVELIKKAKRKGLEVTAETAPHYFSLSKEDIINEEARFKMNPPLRSKEDVKAIIKGLCDGTIDVIATDHAPHSYEEKTLEFKNAPMGIVGLETAFSLGYTNLVKAGYLTLPQLVEKMSINPAKILKLSNYGKIEQSILANLVIVDENVQYKVNQSKFYSKCKISPFDGKILFGKVVNTILEGSCNDN